MLFPFSIILLTNNRTIGLLNEYSLRLFNNLCTLTFFGLNVFYLKMLQILATIAWRCCYNTQALKIIEKPNNLSIRLYNLLLMLSYR